MGQISGLLIAGLTNDIIFENSSYILVIVWNIVSIFWNLWEIIFASDNTDRQVWSLSLNGMASGFTDMYIMWLIPMTLADKNRVVAYELTMFGTMIALVHFCTYFSISLLSSLSI